MPMPLAHLLEGLLRSHGHAVSLDAGLEGRRGAVYTVPLLAESAAHGNVVLTGDIEQGLDPGLAQEFRDTLDDVGADLGILVHGGDDAALDADVLDVCAGRIALWDRATTARVLGDALLAQELGLDLQPLPLEAVLARPAMAPTPSFALDAFEALTPPQDGADSPRARSVLDEALPALISDLMPPAFRQTAPDPEPIVPLHSLGILDVPLAESAHELGTASRAPSPTVPSWQPAPAASTPPQASTPAAWTPSWSSGNLPPPRRLQPHAPLPAQPVAAAHAQPAVAPSLFPPLAPAAATTHAPSMQAPAQGAVPPRRTSRPLLPVRVTAEAAQRKVKDKLFGIQAVELVLHPVHLFDYEVDDLRKGSLAYDTLDGRVQVHAADKSILAVDPDLANPDGQTALAPDHTYAMQERVLRIDAERAAQLAHEHVRKAHTRSVEMRVQDEDNSLYYTERRKVEPTPQQVRIKLVGTYFRAAWRLLGRNGQVDIDALDGRELFSEVRGGRTDAMMLE